jgi:3-oxoadipate enol-lactonase
VVPLIRRARLIGKDTSVGDLREVLDQLARVDPHTAPPMLLSCQRHDAHDVLTRLTVPLLIMAGGRDPFMPAQRVALPMHHAAPGSELVLLEQATHSALLDFPEEIAHAVDDFIMRRVQSAASAHAER